MLVRALRRAKFSAPSFDFAAEMRELLNAGQPLSMLEEVYRDFPALDAATVEALSDMLVRAEAVEFRSFGLRILQYRRQVPRQEAFRIVTVALRDGLWVESWDCIWSVLHETEAEARKDPELVAVLEERVCGALDSEQAYVLGNSEWYIEHVLEMIVANDVAHRQRLVKRLVRTRNSWRDPAVKLARSASQKG